MTLSDDQMWEMVQRRDTQGDGQFYVGVHSTGIYCCPSCKSRMPLRRNVHFYATPDAAEANGLRACKRCHPRDWLHNPTHDLVARVRATIEAAPDQRITLDDLAAQHYLSPAYLQRVFKAAVGVSPAEYGRSLRMQHLQHTLRDDASVTDAIYRAGYVSSSHAHATSAALGMTLGSYRRGGEHQTIYYDLCACPLGVLLVAATERGLCAVKLGDDHDALRGLLAREYYAAVLIEDAAVLRPYTDMIQHYLAGQKQTLDMPLDIQGTVFQRKVWDALRRIPYGERRTYRQIAEDIQQPGAVRAVGSACGANPVALVIPCHRVVRSGGELGGYEWGLERKHALLTQEQRLADAPHPLP